jgi:hypothetical protein
MLLVGLAAFFPVLSYADPLEVTALVPWDTTNSKQVKVLVGRDVIDAAIFPRFTILLAL